MYSSAPFMENWKTKNISTFPHLWIDWKGIEEEIEQFLFVCEDLQGKTLDTVFIDKPVSKNIFSKCSLALTVQKSASKDR